MSAQERNLSRFKAHSEDKEELKFKVQSTASYRLLPSPHGLFSFLFA